MKENIEEEQDGDDKAEDGKDNKNGLDVSSDEEDNGDEKGEDAEGEGDEKVSNC